MNSTVLWPDESLAVRIHCAPGLLTELDVLATDGLLAMPRTGLGIGGLLLGNRSGDRVEIQKTIPIACSHAMGPSFVLTPEELEASQTLLSQEGEIPADLDAEPAADRIVVGCYFSRPNGRMELSENDRTLFESLCPEQWQLGLLIRPSLGQNTVAAFVFSGIEAGIRLGIPGELTAPDKSEGESETIVEDFAPAVDVVLPVVPADPAGPAETKKPQVPEEPPPSIIPKTPASTIPDVIPVAMPRTGTIFGAPDLAERRRNRRQRARRILTALVLLALLAAAAYFTGYWLARRPARLSKTPSRATGQLICRKGEFRSNTTAYRWRRSQDL